MIFNYHSQFHENVSSLGLCLKLCVGNMFPCLPSEQDSDYKPRSFSFLARPRKAHLRETRNISSPVHLK